jgi:hypothetical protein
MRDENNITYLVEIMYYDTHNTEVITLTTEDLNWSMNQYQRNRKPFDWEKLDWKREGDPRELADERDME